MVRVQYYHKMDIEASISYLLTKIDMTESVAGFGIGIEKQNRRLLRSIAIATTMNVTIST